MQLPFPRDHGIIICHDGQYLLFFPSRFPRTLRNRFPSRVHDRRHNADIRPDRLKPILLSLNDEHLEKENSRSGIFPPMGPRSPPGAATVAVGVFCQYVSPDHLWGFPTCLGWST